MYVCMTSLSLSMYIYIYIYTHVYTRVYIYIYIHIHICIHVMLYWIGLAVEVRHEAQGPVRLLPAFINSLRVYIYTHTTNYIYIYIYHTCTSYTYLYLCLCLYPYPYRLSLCNYDHAPLRQCLMEDFPTHFLQLVQFIILYLFVCPLHLN